MAFMIDINNVSVNDCATIQSLLKTTSILIETFKNLIRKIVQHTTYNSSYHDQSYQGNWNYFGTAYLLFKIWNSFEIYEEFIWELKNEFLLRDLSD